MNARSHDEPIEPPAEYPQAGFERLIMPPPMSWLGTENPDPEGALLARRGPGTVLMMGDNPALPKMPARPRLLDFFKYRFTDITIRHLLTSAQRGYAAGLMENITPSQRWGVCAGVPAQVTVALKNGWLPLNQAGTDWQINSVGWVSGLGRDYLIAVLSTGNPAEQYGIDTIDELSAAVWNHMG